MPRVPQSAVFAIGTAVVAAFMMVPAQARSVGETFSCTFPKAGRVAIDTREPGTTITYKGKRYPATSGSYFYQTEGGITAMFKPNMRHWDLMVGETTEASIACTRVKNKPRGR